MSSSFSRTRPPLATNASSVSVALGVSGIISSPRNSNLSTGSIRNGPNSYKCLSWLDISSEKVPQQFRWNFQETSKPRPYTVAFLRWTIQAPPDSEMFEKSKSR